MSSDFLSNGDSDLLSWTPCLASFFSLAFSSLQMVPSGRDDKLEWGCYAVSSTLLELRVLLWGSDHVLSNLQMHSVKLETLVCSDLTSDSSVAFIDVI